MIEILRELTTKINSKPNIVCMGLYNHGKSTLLNALVKDYDCKSFVVADKRETTENKSIETENAIFTDTPGLDANSKDTQTALNSINLADIVIIVHSLSEGELHKNEINYIKNHLLTNGINFIAVINHIIGEGKEKAKEKISSQLKEISGKNIDIFFVETISYIKGKKENKEGLVKNSGYLEFEKYLNNFILNTDFTAIRKNKINKICDQTRKEIENQILTTLADINKEEEKMQNLANEINDITQIIQGMKSGFKELYCRKSEETLIAQFLKLANFTTNMALKSEMEKHKMQIYEPCINAIYKLSNELRSLPTYNAEQTQIKNAWLLGAVSLLRPPFTTPPILKIAESLLSNISETDATNVSEDDILKLENIKHDIELKKEIKNFCKKRIQELKEKYDVDIDVNFSHIDNYIYGNATNDITDKIFNSITNKNLNSLFEHINILTQKLYETERIKYE